MCIVEIRPGRGGQDASRFADNLADAIRAWAARNGSRAAVASADARTVAVAVPGVSPGALR